MGYIRHHAIVVTSWDEKLLAKAHEMAKICGNNVTDIVGPLTNGCCTFCIVPDGSKEGWSTSYEGDDARLQFIAWMNHNRHECGSSSLQWVEVFYGNDDGKAQIVDSTWHYDVDPHKN